jgi:hypothetical protein
MAAGCIPIVGYNMGARLTKRVKSLFTKLLIAEASVGVVALIIVELLPQQLIAIFGAANESVYYTSFAVRAFRIYLSTMIFSCIKTRLASSFCRQWERLLLPQLFLLFERLYSALVLHCFCLCCLDWTVYCIPYLCPTSYP